MKRELSAALALSLFSAPAVGEGIEGQQSLLYVKVPLAFAQRQRQSLELGFMIRRSPHRAEAYSSSLREAPLLDYKFASTGLRSLSVFGLEVGRLKASEDSPETKPVDPIVPVVVVIAGAAAVAISRNRKDKQEERVCPAIFPPPAGC